jgi:hypothetical protein
VLHLTGNDGADRRFVLANDGDMTGLRSVHTCKEHVQCAVVFAGC